MEKLYRSYKYYDDKGRRLAIFGYKSDNVMKMMVITCSKKDQFTKSIARSLYTEFQEKKSFIDAPISSESTPGVTFDTWCRTNFRKKYIMRTGTTPLEAQIIHIKKIGSMLTRDLEIEYLK